MKDEIKEYVTDLSDISIFVYWQEPAERVQRCIGIDVHLEGKKGALISFRNPY